MVSAHSPDDQRGANAFLNSQFASPIARFASPHTPIPFVATGPFHHWFRLGHTVAVVGAAFGPLQVDSALAFSIESTGSAWRHCCAIVQQV